MDDLLNIIAGRSSRQDGRLAQPRMAIVADVNPSDYTVKVQLQPGSVLTGWIPCGALAVGNGLGIVCPPIPGDQVFVVPQEGNVESYQVVGRVFSQKAMPPISLATSKPVQPGEFGIFINGAFMHFAAGGNIYMTANQITTKGPWSHTGDITVTGTLTVSGIIKSLTDVFAKTVSLLFHKNTNVQSGGGLSGPPQQY